MSDNGCVQSRLVNRRRELKLLSDAISVAAAGRGQVILITGEAGIGKSRLANEAAGLAQEHGWDISWGKCWLGDEAPTYWPWLSVLRSCVGEDRTAAIIGDLISTSKTEVSEAHDLFRYEPVLDALTRGTEMRPRMLIFDDLHAADEPSLSLLRLIVDAIRTEKVVILGTYRAAAVDHGSATARVLSAIAHDASLMTLAGLSEDAAMSLFEDMSERAAPPSISAAVYEATSGNPFFVQEIARQLETTGELRRPDHSVGFMVPSRIQELFRQRLDAMAPDALEILAVAAVIGRQFDLERLAAVTATETQTLVTKLDIAIRAGLISERSLGRYEFPHVMIRETLYEGLPAADRMELHHRIGNALERMYDEDLDAHIGEVAHHFFKAGHLGDLQKGLEYSQRAAEAAGAMGARDEEVRHWYRALRLAEAAEADPETRARLAEFHSSARGRASSDDGGEAFEHRISAFAREGEYWTVTFGGRVARLKDSKGMGMLARLLVEPAREFHAIELAADRAPRTGPIERDSTETPVVDSGDAGPVLDEEAKRAYRARMRDLEEDLREAEDFNDAERADQLRNEIEFLRQELAAAVGIGGRDRKAASASERARVSATRAVRSAIKRIEEELPDLAEHLNATVRTGTYLSYVPDPRLRADWRT